MKKISLLMVMILMVSTVLIGCGGSKTSQSSKTESFEVAGAEFDVKVMSCRFKETVTAMDGEYSSMSFQDMSDKVYIDLVLQVENNSALVISKDEFAGSYRYNGEDIELQYEKESSGGTGFSTDDDIQGNELAYVHLLSYVEDAAQQKGITVKYTIAGKEFSCKVDKMSSKAPLENKEKVKVGDRINANGRYNFEVMKCSLGDYVYASKAEDQEQYKIHGKKLIDLVLEVENLTNIELQDIFTYTVVDGKVVRGTAGMEKDNNTDIDMYYVDLKHGENGIVHLYVGVDEASVTDDLLMRFNLGGKCYYCEVEK